MAKITEKLLLERSSNKSTKLEQIQELNLSKLCLRSSDLPVPLLSRLSSLQRLDLSGNQLKDLPRHLGLSNLKQLDLSDNNMEDVTSLEGMRSLEELSMEDNLYITVSDNYKMMVLLPQLRIYNGKDVTATANHIRYVYTDNLQTRIVSLWQKSFSLPQTQSKDKMAALETNFINTAKQQVKFGPSSVSDFTKWRVGILAAEFFKSLTQPNEPQKTSSTEDPEKSTPVKRKRSSSPSDAKLTPVKKTLLPASPARESPRKTSLRLTPQKQNQNQSQTRLKQDQNQTQTRLKQDQNQTKNQTKSPVKSALKVPPLKENQVRSSPRKPAGNLTPQKKNASTGSPFKTSSTTGSPFKTSSTSRDPPGGHQTRQSKENQTIVKPSRTPAEDLQKTSFNQKPVGLKPLHVLQCHSKQDSDNDLSTQLWACAFQPSDSGGGRLVASCGGDSVCLIDCEAGVVMKKYKVPGEEFFTLSWTTLLMFCGKSSPAVPCSVLAVGGRRGVVKLLHPRNNVAYGEFRAARKALSTLRFNPNQGNFLYSGAYDNKVALWDIGGLDHLYNYKVVQLMSLDCSSAPLHLRVPPKAPLSHLLTACDGGMFCFSKNKDNSATRWSQLEVLFPVYEKEDSEHDYHTVDGLDFLSDDIVASKNFPHSGIYLWSWTQTVVQAPQRKRSKTTAGTTAVTAVVLMELSWFQSAVPYLGLSTCPQRSYVLCGDDRGQMWTFHITGLDKKKTEAKVLSWPSPQKNGEVLPLPGSSINAVTSDPEMEYVVALTDKNLVLVWKREEN